MRATTIVTQLQCSQCSARFPISRKKHKVKKAGHIKTLWCYNCRNTTRHTELDRYQS